MNEAGKIKPVISNKPYSVPIEMRPLWRICLILISIVSLSGEKRYLSVKKVNMLVWMLIRKKRWREYEDYLHERVLDIPLVSVDTATFKAVEFALAKDFILLKDGRLHVTESGLEVYQLVTDNEIMLEELWFLRKVGKKLSDRKVKEISGGLL
ncbi:hypothetical protein [Alteromonas sp. M12]|uniref:hypothetical protein n=1 Tax=Alteromonas sp. M12 TaxID=3135644 RepID=UPI00319D92B2|tara:strand:- start:758 stop:1216 length:459 start_codon:yes stop_codon:yes gene_type:complete